MKILDNDCLKDRGGRQLKANDAFSFACHAGLSCFNQCCRNLNLFLYPYDVLRLKNHLRITSEKFIDTHVDLVLREGSYLPDVLLTMADNDQQTCPFLTDQGCSVYEDRPYSCRMFPIEQGAFFDESSRQTEMVSFYRPPDFCRGQEEQQTMTPKDWIADQEAEKYVLRTRQWGEIKALFGTDPWRGTGPYSPMAKMVFMAAYNVDAFREFVLNSSFLKRYKVKPALQKKLRVSDTELMAFGWEWIKLHLWGKPSPMLRQK